MCKHSHNTYWNEGGAVEALHNDCNIIECDVIYKNGNVMLSHSWRPFKFMCYGPLGKYLEYFSGSKNNRIIYLYIEIKTGDEKIIYKLEKLLLKYSFSE